MNRILHLWMGLACLGALLLGCNDIPSTPTYCETHDCKPSSEVRHRPTSFALELQVNDSSDSRIARLFTLDCAYLPDEDSTKISTFCVDSLKYGEGDSLVRLPQMSKYSYNYNYPYGKPVVSSNGHALDVYVPIPIDDDNHLRFTLVDREKKEKKMDVDLSDYVEMYKVHGDTFDFEFPPRTSFASYSRGFIDDGSIEDHIYDPNREYGCYEYTTDTTYLDSVLYCAYTEGQPTNGYDLITVVSSTTEQYVRVSDSSSCKSKRFYLDVKTVNGWHYTYIDCYKNELAAAPKTLTVSDLYSVPLMEETVRKSLSEDAKGFDGIRGHRHTWHTMSVLEDQGPKGEDDFTIYVIYKD